MNTPEQFNASYFAAQPLQVQQALHTTTAGTAERQNAVYALKDQGFVIDRQIMLMGYDPYKTMWARHVYGYTWVDSLDQAGVVIPPGFVMDGRSYDPNHPPAKSIAVPDPDTCDLAKWYPAAHAPALAPPPPAPTGPFVGAPYPEISNLVANAFHATAEGEKLPTGKTVTENGAIWTKGLFQTFATMLHYFTKNA